MKVSLITATYNREATVGQAIASVAAQTHSDIEHLIIDGASTDGTMTVVAAMHSPAMRTLSEPDAGLYDAFNKGLRMATGDIVGFVHSDDFLADETVVAKVVDAFADPAVTAVYGDLDYVAATDTGRVIRRWRSRPYAPHLIRRGWMPAHPTLFVRRSAVAAVGDYDTSYCIAADYDWILRLVALPGFRAVHVPHVFVKMRVGGASNATLKAMLAKSREDWRAMRKHRAGGIGTLLAKNLGKIGQFLPSSR